MRGLINLLLAVFGVTLAVVIGNRMSTEAMAVVIGVVCGVVASIPMSVILLVITGRLIGAERHSAPIEEARGQGITGQAPPVVVVGPSLPYGLAGQYLGPYLAPGAMPSPPRRFEIVGEEAE